MRIVYFYFNYYSDTPLGGGVQALKSGDFQAREGDSGVISVRNP